MKFMLMAAICTIALIGHHEAKAHAGGQQQQNSQAQQSSKAAR